MRRNVAKQPQLFKHFLMYQKNGGPETIRTSDPCLRRAILYPAELRDRWGFAINAFNAEVNML